MDWCWRKIVKGGWLAAVGALALTATSVAQPSPAPRVSAVVDKVKVAVGEQLTLTITFSGDLNDVALDPRGVPPSFVVVAQSRSQNVRFMQGNVENSLSLSYVLVPREPGTFQLGPLRLHQGRTTFLTNTLTIDVIRSALPPPSSRPVERLTI